MKKHTKLSILILTAALIFSACRSSTDEGQNSEPDSDSRPGHSIQAAVVAEDFDDGFEITNMKNNLSCYMSLKLPDGWSVSRSDDRYNHETENIPKYPVYLTGIEEIYDIHNADGQTVGAIGFMEFDPDDTQDNPKAIYSAVRLPNDYNFNVTFPEDDPDNGFYTPIREHSEGVTALTKVYYIPHFAASAGYPEEERRNQGIMTYNLAAGVYIVIEIDKDVLSDKDISRIAMSIEFK